MSGLAELERAKRRCLQQAYTDLRPMGKGNDDERQAELRRDLKLGAAAGASPPAGGGSSRVQSSGALAAAAAASINGVECAIPRATSKTAGSGSGSGSGGVRRNGSAASGSAAVSVTRAPPPGPMDGGFLPESDPVRRLSQLPLPIGGGSCGSNRLAW
ncbi:hypothetical protein VaNZ11_011362 [Volvox africanus]|uniref:Uncharacterized protein n=1 Tax=Volvox africanus TaxID=51714 RepID=A0ABQ5SB76_9CHLO|nr:hypothetical protein VaNZ11_011362 [Volvox africanus]